MFVALDETNTRAYIDDAIADNYRDKRYYCPYCGQELIVRNGKFVTAHFAHKSGCTETYTEDICEWHLQWQSLFPKETREVVIEAEIPQQQYEIEKTFYMPRRKGYHRRAHLMTNEYKNDTTAAIHLKHRADVCIGNYVIEFQHSPISAEEFAERNIFYTLAGYKVVWVFDFIDAVADGKMDICEEIEGKFYNKTKWKWKYPSKTFSYFSPEVFRTQSITKVAVFFQLFESSDYKDTQDCYIEQLIWCIHDTANDCEDYRRFMTRAWPGNFTELYRAIQNDKLFR